MQDEGDEEGGSGDLGQAIAEVDGGSPRRGGSPRTGAAAFFLGGASSGGLSAAGSVPKSLGNSVALQEEDTRDAKGRVRSFSTLNPKFLQTSIGCRDVECSPNLPSFVQQAAI